MPLGLIVGDGKDARDATSLPPSAGFQFFGEAKIDARGRDMVVSLKDIEGVSVFSQRLHARQWGCDDDKLGATRIEYPVSAAALLSISRAAVLIGPRGRVHPELRRANAWQDWRASCMPGSS